MPQEKEVVLGAGDSIGLEVDLPEMPVELNGTIGYDTPMGMGVAHNLCAKVVPNQRHYKCEFRIPEHADSMVIHIVNWVWYAGDTNIKLDIPPTTLRVIGNPPIVLTGHAGFKITLSQTQLLRQAAFRLDQRTKDLQARVKELQQAQEGPDKLNRILQDHVDDAVSALQSTEEDFQSPVSDHNELERSKIFFDDLRRRYRDALADLKRSAHGAAVANPIVLAADHRQTLDYIDMARPVISASEDNIAGYLAVAEGGSTGFDLEVSSTPQGATVFYYRVGDSPKEWGKPTDTTITALAYARWHLRFVKRGYHTIDRPFDGIHDRVPSLHVDLEKK